jgi:hypothetical protein
VRFELPVHVSKRRMDAGVPAGTFFWKKPSPSAPLWKRFSVTGRSRRWASRRGAAAS